MIGEGVRVIEYYEDDLVESAGGDLYPVPAVAVANRYVKRRRKIALKKRNLLIRDNHTCQYCEKELAPKTATIDHVVPKAHFEYSKDAHTWDNTVIACLRCNSRKDDRTPEQAGMKLLTVPVEPDASKFYTGMSPWTSMPDEWRLYVRA